MDAGTLRWRDVGEDLRRQWDALPPRRGLQADVYDSHAWLASWCSVGGSERQEALRIPVVADGDGLVAALPLLLRSRGRAVAAGADIRTRYRPVLGTERPDPAVSRLLVEQVCRLGARDLALHRMPSRDPATASLLEALREAGFTVSARERSRDCLAVVDGGWAEHRRRFAGFDRSVRTKSNRLRPMWDVRLHEYGPRATEPAEQGFDVYLGLLARSWKGPLAPAEAEQRRHLLRRTQELGWCRLYVLEVGGVPAAAHLWFRVGDVATWLSTAYDQRLAALSPGSVVMWEAQRSLFEEGPPRLVDYLPGENPLKDRIAPDRAPLLVVEAARGTVFSGVTFPARRFARVASAAARARSRAWLRARRASRHRDEPAVAVRRTAVAPSADGVVAVPLELTSGVRRYLALAGGHPSPEAMADGWGPEDAWWYADGAAPALVRVGPDAAAEGCPLVAREVVRLTGTGTAESAVAAVAAAVCSPVHVDVPRRGSGTRGAPLAVHDAVLPWPPAWTPVGSPARDAAAGTGAR